MGNAVWWCIKTGAITAGSVGLFVALAVVGGLLGLPTTTGHAVAVGALTSVVLCAVYVR